MQTHLYKKTDAFTVIELIIVIVIIAILAVIAMVSYSGTQERARYATMKQDLSTIDKAIRLYHSDTGHYPYSGATGGSVTADSTTTLAIPGDLVPEYLPKTPPIPNDGKGGHYAYMWTAGGADYKLVRLATTAANLPSVETNDSTPDPARTDRGWGFWSDGGASL